LQVGGTNVKLLGDLKQMPVLGSNQPFMISEHWGAGRRGVELGIGELIRTMGSATSDCRGMHFNI
jgi:hypothetical protein